MSHSLKDLEAYINTFDITTLRQALVAGNKDAYRNGILPLFQALLEYLPHQKYMIVLGANKKKYTDDGALPPHKEFQGEVFIHLTQTVIPKYNPCEQNLCTYFNSLFEKRIKTISFKEHRPGGIHYPNEKQYSKYKNFIKLYQSKHTDKTVDVNSPAFIEVIVEKTGLTKEQCAVFSDPYYGKSAIFDKQTDEDGNEYSLFETAATQRDDFSEKKDEYRYMLSVINAVFMETPQNDKPFLSKLLTTELCELIGKLDPKLVSAARFQNPLPVTYDFIDAPMLSRCFTENPPDIKDIEREMGRYNTSGTKLLIKFRKKCKIFSAH